MLSRLMAKWFMGVKVIPENTSDQTLRELVGTVHDLARQAGLPKPEVGVFESPEVNAFATGPSQSRALVAVSTGLLRNLNSREAAAVLGHEVTHIANGDMVTMTLVQGVINALVIFLARVLAFLVSQAMRSRDDRGSFWMQYLLVQVFQVVFSLLGMTVVCWFSRQREFRADAGGAKLAGRQNMIDALRALQRFNDPVLAAAEAKRAPSFETLKISAPRASVLFATHPPLEERIARLNPASKCGLGSRVINGRSGCSGRVGREHCVRSPEGTLLNANGPLRQSLHNSSRARNRHRWQTLLRNSADDLIYRVRRTSREGKSRRCGGSHPSRRLGSVFNDVQQFDRSVVVHSHRARIGINLHDLDFSRTFAFGEHQRFVLLRRRALCRILDFHHHQLAAENSRDASERDLGRWRSRRFVGAGSNIGLRLKILRSTIPW